MTVGGVLKICKKKPLNWQENKSMDPFNKNFILISNVLFFNQTNNI